MKLTAKLLKKLIQEEVQKEGRKYHDMGGEDEMYNILDMPKRLDSKEIFGEFRNFVERNGISMEQLEAMALLQQFMKEYSVDAEEVSNMADMMKGEDPLNESPSMEHITPENIMMVINVLKDLGLLVAPMAGAALGINKMLDKTNKPEVSEK
jgi:urease gamma subunit